MKWLAYLVMIIAQVAIFDHLSKLDGPFGANLILMVVMTFVAILFHELGHAIAVWHGGGTVHAIVVSFVRYNVAKRRLEPAPATKSREFGGYVSYSFNERMTTMRKEMRIAFAGPAANALTAILALLIAFSVAPSVSTLPPVEIRATQPADLEAMRAKPAMLPSEAAIEKAFADLRERERAIFWQTVLQAFAMLSFGLALTNLVPFKGSDGAAILYNWRKPKRKFGMR